MEIHIGKEVKKVMWDKKYSATNLAKALGLHLGSISRIYAYKSMQTEMLKKICIYLEHDFFALYTIDLNFKKEVIDTTSETEKSLAESKKEVEEQKKEISYLKEINQFLRKK